MTILDDVLQKENYTLNIGRDKQKYYKKKVMRCVARTNHGRQS